MAQVLREIRQRPSPAFFSTMAGMELRDIPERLARMGRKQRDLADHLQVDPSTVSKLIKGSRGLQIS